MEGKLCGRLGSDLGLDMERGKGGGDGRVRRMLKGGGKSYREKGTWEIFSFGGF